MNEVSERYSSSLQSRFARYGAHYKLLDIIGENKRILDVGCASGYLGARLKEMKCFVVGLDTDANALSKAREYCDDVIQGNIETLEEFGHYNFDVILFADVLEHLVRPDTVLMKVRRFLGKGGYVLASIPNVAYLPCRLRITFGQFPYEETGHFDKTHLRFFVLKTARLLFQSAGYRITGLTFTGIPVLSRIVPTVFAMKFIVRGEPVSC